MALDLLEKVPYSKLEGRNIFYGKQHYELDGLLTLRKSTWFIECKSRNLSPDSLRGDRKKIDKDTHNPLIHSIRGVGYILKIS